MTLHRMIDHWRMVIPILRSRMLMRRYPTWRPCNCQSALLSRELFLIHGDERFVVSSSDHKPVINAIKWNENDWPTLVPQELGTQLKAIISPTRLNRDIQVLIRFENIAHEIEGAMEVWLVLAAAFETSRTASRISGRIFGVGRVCA